MLEIQDQLHSVNTIQSQLKENVEDQTSTHFYIIKYAKLGYAVLNGSQVSLASKENTGNSSVFSCFCGRRQSRLFVS